MEAASFKMEAASFEMVAASLEVEAASFEMVAAPNSSSNSSSSTPSSIIRDVVLVLPPPRFQVTLVVSLIIGLGGRFEHGALTATPLNGTSSIIFGKDG